MAELGCLASTPLLGSKDRLCVSYQRRIFGMVGIVAQLVSVDSRSSRGASAVFFLF
jgi:hypothetical protein